MHDQRSTTSGRLLLLLAGVLVMAGGCKQEADRLVPTLAWYLFDEPSGAFREAALECTEQTAGRYAIVVAPLGSRGCGHRY